MMRYLALLLVLSPLFGCALPETGDPVADLSETIVDDESLALATTALVEGRYGAARDAFERLLHKNPENLEARLGLAEAQLGLGDTAAAKAAFANLARTEGTVRIAALQGLGLADLQRGDNIGARGALSTAVELDANAWRAWNGLAHLHDAEQDWSEADNAYARAVASAPHPEVVINNWGMSLLSRGDPEAARVKFEDVLRMRPDFTTAQTNLLLAFALSGRESEVLAQVSGEDLPQTLNNLGYMAMVQGELSRAEAYFHQALEASPSFYGRAFENLQRLSVLRQRMTTS